MHETRYRQLETYMLTCMGDSAHDAAHVYRVLYLALELAREDRDIDRDTLIAACLLHDIGRSRQFDDPRVCHAKEGANMAREFLLSIGVDAAAAEKIADCVRTHRYRADDPPHSIEAKILFDADKLDATGAMGIARTLMYQGYVGTRIYDTHGGGALRIEDGKDSFLKEYNFKLRNIYGTFYTYKAKAIAAHRREIAAAYVESLIDEIGFAHKNGADALQACIEVCAATE